VWVVPIGRGTDRAHGRAWTRPRRAKSGCRGGIKSVGFEPCRDDRPPTRGIESRGLTGFGRRSASGSTHETATVACTATQSRKCSRSTISFRARATKATTKMGRQLCIHGFMPRVCVVSDCPHWDGEPDPDLPSTHVAHTGERYRRCLRCGNLLSDLRWRAGRAFCSDYCTTRGQR